MPILVHAALVRADGLRIAFASLGRHAAADAALSAHLAHKTTFLWLPRRCSAGATASLLGDGALAADTASPTDPDADKSRLRAAVEALVNEADDSEVQRLEAAATAGEADDLDERFWGPSPDSVTAVRAVFADLRDQFAQRQQLAANSITREDAAELLGISAQSVTDKLAARKLVGIKVGREWRLPAWQFDPDMPDSVLPDLNTLQTVFPGGPVSLSQWILRPQAEFDGRNPREELILHGSAPVIELAGVLTATGW